MPYLPKLRKYKFIFDFLQTREVYAFYDRVLNTTNQKAFLDGSKKDAEYPANNICIVHYIPPFLQPQIGDANKHGLRAIKFKRFKGFMADLKGYTSLDQYLSAQLSAKRRKNLRSYVRKLDHCFNISHELYFGEIHKQQYDLLLAQTRLFLQQRFQQKGDTHELLASWHIMEKTTYDLIMSKRASLFVTYHKEDPISICLNYHHDTIFHSAVVAYDIAYSKFSLGHVNIQKLLEWCFANGMRLFDLSVGDLDYKRIWSNVIYDFEHQIIFRQNSLLHKWVAYGLIGLYHLKAYLKKMHADTLYHTLRGFISKDPEQDNSYSAPPFELVEWDRELLSEQDMLVDLSHEAYAFLKKPVIDFQFSFDEKTEDIKVYRANDKEDSFYILGKKAGQQLNVK